MEEYQRHTDSVFFLVKYYKKHACPAVIVRIEQSKESVRRKTRKNCQKKRRTTENAIIYCFFSLEDYFQPVSLDYRDTVKLYRSIFSRDGHNSERLNLVNTSSNAAYILFLCFILSLLLFSIISYPIRSP